MFGYVFAASELGIRHEIWDLQVNALIECDVAMSAMRLSAMWLHMGVCTCRRLLTMPWVMVPSALLAG